MSANHWATLSRRPADHGRRRAMRTSATSSDSGPPLRSSARSTTSRTSSSGSGSVPASAAATTSASPSSPSRALPAPMRPSVTPSVYSSRRPGVRQRDLERGPDRVLEHAERRAGRRRVERRDRAVREQQRRGMAGEPDRRPRPVRGERDRAERREDVWRVALDDEHVLERVEQPLGRDAGQHQRPPRDPHADAERRLVGAVPGDVADQRLDRPVGGLDGVEEVPAEQRPAAPRAVVGGEPQAGVGDQQGRQQSALEPRVLARLELRDRELLLRELRPPPLGRVAQRPREQHPARRALDDVVLRARGDRLDAALLVGEAREHEHRELGRRVTQPVERIEALRVRQVEVEQRAVEGGEPRDERVGERPPALEVDLRAGELELLLDDQRVAVVVLDEQHAHPPARRHRADVERRIHGAGTLDGPPRGTPGATSRPRAPGRRPGSAPPAPPPARAPGAARRGRRARAP